ncbi:oxidoreductase [Echria macrotheca]|uniref:Oxidoreductase n=1 Tax=Echria macrotheca TaxID=438768 RepID=A0AAJ0BCL2_9PEZI|nr:oxidoreductase [Echria macrotheca]
MDETKPSSRTATDPKVIVITGGTSGLGAASAVALARSHPSSKIYIVARRASPAASVAAEIRTVAPSAVVEFVQCDLADLRSVSAAAEHILGREKKVDVVMANAGIAPSVSSTTEQGYELYMGTNHIGHALLLSKLLPLLRAAGEGARVVSVTSFAFRAALKCDPIGSTQSSRQKGWSFDLGFKQWLRYAESKLATITYTAELARRYPDITFVSVSPGFVQTDMVAKMSLCDRLVTRLLAWLVGGGMVGPEDGAANQVWAATVDVRELSNGAMYEPVGRICPVKSEPPLIREKLWDWTESAVARWL